MDTPTQPHPDELLELADLIGVLAKRIDAIEAQAGPLEAAKQVQVSAIEALNAAVAGIKALDADAIGKRLEALESEVSAA